MQPLALADARVLIADANASVRAAFRHLFKSHCCLVVEAVDGHAALCVLDRSHQPLVALVSLRLPALDGAGLLAS